MQEVVTVYRNYDNFIEDGHLIPWRGKVVNGIPILYPHWIVSFDIFPTDTVLTGTSIFHMTASSRGSATYGDRTPAMTPFSDCRNYCIR